MNSILREYSIKNIIGKGTFSIVKLGINRRTGEKVAIKILEKKKILTKSDAERVKREIDILKNINHINLIKINKIKEDSKYYYIIMEYCEMGELFNYILKKRKLNENESAYYFFQLIKGLEYIHSKKIVHRDLKPENLLINKKNILKIIDFGLSNYNKNNELLCTPCGSPCYASPEMIAGKKYDGNSIDIWSSGIILFIMLCGYLPFEGQNNDILFKNIMICKVEYPKYLSYTSINLLKKILVPYPEERISLLEIKTHPFYNKGKNIFKKLHPYIFDELENNYQLRNKNEKNNYYDYCNCVNKTEVNEKIEYKHRKYFHSMNFDNESNNNIFINKNKSIYNLDKINTNQKKYLLDENLNKSKFRNNKYYFKQELDNLDNHIYTNNSRMLTDIDDCNLNDIKKIEKSNNDKIRKQKDLSKLLNYVKNINNDKSYISNTKNKQQNIDYSPIKIRNNFHSIDIDNSNLLFNLYNFYNVKKNNKNMKRHIYNNKNHKNIINKDCTTRNSIYDKNFIIKKIKSLKKKKKNNTNNNTKILDKYKYEEKNNDNNIILNKRKKVKNFDFHTLSVSKNFYTDFIINNEKKYKKRHISDLSYNYPLTKNINEDLKLNKKKKFSRIVNKDLKHNRRKNPDSEKNLLKNNFIINNFNYDTEKYNLKDNINKENDNYFINYKYNRPSVTINNMNYNLNLYEPKIYVSAFNNENLRGNNNYIQNNNKNHTNNQKELSKKNSIKYFSNLNSANYKNNKNKDIDYLIKLNFLTHNKSINNDSLTNNYKKNNFNLSNNKNFVKIKKYMTINKTKLFENIKEKKNNINIKNGKRDEMLTNKKNNKENIKIKKINTGKRLDFGNDLLNIMRQKKAEKNKILNSEHQKLKMLTPSMTMENNNLNTFNNINNVNKVLIKDLYNKKINNKLKKSNDIKNNVIDILIKDFLNFNDIKNKNKNKLNKV